MYDCEKSSRDGDVIELCNLDDEVSKKLVGKFHLFIFVNMDRQKNILLLKLYGI